MKTKEADKAHEVSELFQDLIVSMGVTLLSGLTKEQQEYVLTKAHDEFRFWRIEEELR
jgi:hypothetical protein